MFHTILTLSCLILGIYLFLRIWQLFITRKSRLVYIVIFALLFSVFPLSNSAGGRTGQILESLANYLLPFFLYVFLFVLLTDLLLLANLVFKLIPGAELKERPVRSRIFLLIILLSFLVVAGGIINFNTIRKSEYQITVAKKSSEINHLKIAFASDFHINESTPVSFVEKFVDDIVNIKPDIMLFGGDITEGDRQDKKMERFENLLVAIHAPYGVYSVLGNHEHYARQNQGNFFRKAGIEILRDSAVLFANSFILAGRNDSQTRDRKSIDELMKAIPDSLPLILLDHRPNEIDMVSCTKTDIQFSGHSHNGQLFPINLITSKVYLLSWGYKKFRDTHFFVSSGIRLWGPPVRTTGKSEIIVVDVSFK